MPQFKKVKRKKRPYFLKLILFCVKDLWMGGGGRELTQIPNI